MDDISIKDAETLHVLRAVIDSLANGVNYFTGEVAAETDIVNDIKIVRALFSASEVLKEVEKGQFASLRRRKLTFKYNEELISKVEIRPRPVSLSELRANILAAYNGECKMSYKFLSEMLFREGVLVESGVRKPRYIAAESAKKFGIWTEKVYLPYGERQHAVFDENGQRYVLELLKKYY